MTIVEIKKMSKSFGNRQLFHDFNLAIEEHQMIAICGESGCGKTTLLNIIGGLESFDSGEVNLFGKNINDYHGKERRELYKNKMGFLFQNYALIEDETVMNNLIIPIRHQDKSLQEQKINEALEKVDLKGVIDNKVYSLSGGEQQRVALARLLLKPCQLILADEPTGNLDSVNKEIVFQILNHLKQEKSIVIVTHDLDLAKRCDRIIEL